MSGNPSSAREIVPPGGAGARSANGVLLDWVALAGCAWLIGGLYLDGWAHSHVPELETLFTPWHAVLYSGFVVSSAIPLVFMALSVRRGSSWRKAMPPAYRLSLAGSVIFLVGGLGDMVWHVVFGIEEGIDALLSPTHLAMAVGGTLILSGPLRAAWRRGGDGERGWSLWPAVVSLLFVLCVLTFFTRFAHPYVVVLADWQVPPEPSALGGFEDVRVMDADGRRQTRVTYGPGASYGAPAWSPDDGNLAFGLRRGGESELRLVGLDGSGETLSSMADSYDYPAWSPDGTKMAFIAERDGSAGLYVMHADGRDARLLDDDEVLRWRIAWSPGGEKIRYAAKRDGEVYLYEYNLTVGAATRLLNGRKVESMPAWSQDGDRIAFSSRRDGNDDIFVMSLDHRSEVRLTTDRGPDYHPAWSPDGRKIAFTSGRDGDLEIYAVNADGSELTNLTNSPTTRDRLPAWPHDGTRIAYESRPIGYNLVRPFNHALGVTSVLLQAAILMGTVLLAVRRWRMPPGALTLIVGTIGLAMASQQDTYAFVPGAVLAGAFADLMIWRLRPSADRVRPFRAFAFAIPVVLYALYFATIALTGTVRWPVEMWAGSVMLSGVVGWLVSFLALAPRIRPQTPTPSSTD